MNHTIGKRKNYFIDRDFQTKFILKFCLIVIASSALIGVILFLLSGNFTTVAIENTRVTVKKMSDFILPMMAVTLPVVTIFSALSVAVLALYTSHRIAGPLYRLRKDIESFRMGDMKVNFRTRKSDQLQALTASLGDLGRSCRETHLKINDKVGEMRACLKGHAVDRDVIARKVGELEELLKHFKT